MNTSAHMFRPDKVDPNTWGPSDPIMTFDRKKIGLTKGGQPCKGVNNENWVLTGPKNSVFAKL